MTEPTAEPAPLERPASDPLASVTLAELRNVETLLDAVEELPADLGVLLLRTLRAIPAQAQGAGGLVGARLAARAAARYEEHERLAADDDE